MKKQIAANMCALIILSLVLISCAQPFIMTKDLGSQTLSYADGPWSRETWSFAKDGKSGTVEISYFTYNYPTASAAAEAKFDGKEWYQNGGFKGSFSYDPKTLVLTIRYSERYWPKAGLSSPYYKADYEWKNMAKLAAEQSADAVTMTESYKTLFTQDNRLMVFAATGGNYAWESVYNQTTTKGSDVFEFIYNRTRIWTVSSDKVDYSDKQLRTDRTNGVATRIRSYDYIENFEVLSVFELGGGKEGASFAELWKKDKSLSFRLVRTNLERIEYEGTTVAGTPPTKPIADPVSGTGVVGTQNSNPLNYYYVDKNRNTWDSNVQHHGDFITQMPYTAARGIDF